MKVVKTTSLLACLCLSLFSAQAQVKKKTSTQQNGVIISKPSKDFNKPATKYTPKYEYYYLYSQLDGGCDGYMSNIFKIDYAQPFEKRREELIQKAEKFWAIIKPLRAEQGRCEIETNSEEYLDMKVKVWRYVTFETEWDRNLSNLEEKFNNHGRILINID